MDRRAQWGAVHGVAKSQTCLSDEAQVTTRNAWSSLQGPSRSARPSRSFVICLNCLLCSLSSSSSCPTSTISPNTRLNSEHFPSTQTTGVSMLNSPLWNALLPIFIWQAPIQPSKPQTRFVSSMKLYAIIRTDSSQPDLLGIAFSTAHASHTALPKA